MLIRHKKLVRAVFVGHTHEYYRMRVLDPSSDEANDMDKYPDQEGGIYQVDVGASGNGNRNTVVRVLVNGKNVTFRVVQARNGKNRKFRVKDGWEILNN